MKNLEILLRAIQKAKDNGWNTTWPTRKAAWKGDWEDSYDYYKVIFDKEFARCFFGLHEILRHGGKTYDEYREDERTYNHMDDRTIQVNWYYWRAVGNAITAWKFHLQKLVLEEDLIRYLEECL